MQEGVEQKVVILIKSSAKLTADELRKAMAKALAAMKRNRAAPSREKRGKVTVKELAAQNRGMESVEVTDGNIASFNRIARKYGIDFAPFKVKGEDKYLVFFKAPDRDAMTAAFKEYTEMRVRAASRPSLRQRLRQLEQAISRPVKERIRHKEPER